MKNYNKIIQANYKDALDIMMKHPGRYEYYTNSKKLVDKWVDRPIWEEK